MQYECVIEGTFLARPNRFIAHVDVNGQTMICHVKNTGRCRELLIPGVKVLLEYHKDAQTKGRKTAYSLIGVWKHIEGNPPLLINMDSQAPNQAAWEWLQKQRLPNFPSCRITEIRREVTYGDSRFDLAFLLDGHPSFMEVKGVTLEQNGLAMFPDAPTKRGVKHLEELINASKNGFYSFILFVIQMKEITSFSPNRTTHPAFADALAAAQKAGVSVLAMDCQVSPCSMEIDAPVPCILN